MLPILLVFAAVALINLCYYLGFLKFTTASAEGRSTGTILPVSVVICAKNEEENLRNFLPKILEQDHPDFEVVVINDDSGDDTLKVIKEFQKGDPRVKLVDVKNNEAFWANKKYALTLGIKKAQHPYLLFTDADCRPVSDQWIREMSSGFTSQKSIVLGYGGYFSQKGSFLNKLIRFETLFTAIQYFSYAKWGIPYMGVGRNLAYTSEEFFRQNGFADHLHLRSGDDDLFVNHAASDDNTAIVFSPESMTRSIPKQDFRTWFQQKRRHVSIAGHYKKRDRFLLGVFYSTQLLFWILFLFLLFTDLWRFALGFLVLRFIIQGIVFYTSGKKMGEKDIFWLFPFLELFLICTQMGIFIANLIAKPTHWK